MARPRRPGPAPTRFADPSPVPEVWLRDDFSRTGADHFAVAFNVKPYAGVEFVYPQAFLYRPPPPPRALPWPPPYVPPEAQKGEVIHVNLVKRSVKTKMVMGGIALEIQVV